MPTESQSIFASLTPNDWGIIFTMLGVAFAAVLAGIGSAIGVGKAGQAAAGVVAEQPDRFGNCMVLQLLPGSQGHLRLCRSDSDPHLLRRAWRRHLCAYA